MTLVEEAVRAEQISNAFGKYRNPNPDAVQNINAAVAELVSLSWALREIDRLLEDYGSNLYLIEDDLKLVHESVYFTLRDVWHIIGTIGERPEAPLTPDDFRRNWKKIVKYCWSSGGQDLATRLDIYKRFLLALCKRIQSQSSQEPNRDEYGILRRDIRDIEGPTARRLLESGEQGTGPGNDIPAAPGASALATRRSYERQREGAPKSPTESRSSSPPVLSPINNIPSPPTSPTNTFSTASQISSIDRETEHWAIQVFKEIPSWTPLPNSDKKSEYHDVPGQPSYGPPGDSYNEVVVMSFPPDPPGLKVSLFCRRRDWRAKLVAQWRDHRGRACNACLPLNMLIVFRIGSMLHFCRRLSEEGTSLAWLSLKFTTVENMILFACTFLSMRAHDGKRPVKPTDDWEFDGEEAEYAGKIRDNGYSHALRVYKDKTSKAIRLQASVRGGQLNCTPVWTAFVTHHIASKTWCQRLDRNIVCLRELRPHSFSPNYEFQRLPNGAFVLHFESRDDAKEFVSCIESLGRESRRARH